LLDGGRPGRPCFGAGADGRLREMTVEAPGLDAGEGDHDGYDDGGRVRP
jgi:hypothetical protein